MTLSQLGTGYPSVLFDGVSNVGISHRGHTPPPRLRAQRKQACIPAGIGREDPLRVRDMEASE